LDPTQNLKERFLQIGKDYRKNVHLIRDLCAHVIASRKQVNENPEKKMDLIGMFMDMEDENGNPCFSDEELIDLALNFLIAGRDTTAQALSWTFYCFSKYPKTQQKAMEEIKRVMGNADMPRYELMKNLVYVKACFLETLRLYPSVPRNTKMAVEDDIWPDGTFVPKGSYVAWSNYTMGRCPSIWGPDAEEYRPERWLEMSTQPSQFQYTVFHAGPRICLGRNMAELEGTFILACFLKRYTFEAFDLSRVSNGSSITMAMQYGFKGKIVKC
jgi:cytochrome P450